MGKEGIKWEDRDSEVIRKEMVGSFMFKHVVKGKAILSLYSLPSVGREREICREELYPPLLSPLSSVGVWNKID